LIAAILETDDPQRLYTALSLLVSAASEGERVRVLLGFGALTAQFVAGPAVIAAEREPFARTLAALWETALELCDVQACAAAVQATGVEWERVISMPEFVREVADARLVVV
jgi:peroxiredoxin family protein